MVLEDGAAFGDGNHIIYANGAYHNDSSAIGRLMHDFRCTDPEDMYYEPLKKGVRHFKETEGGKIEMSSAIDKWGDARAAEGEAKGMDKFGRLMNYLFQAGRTDDAKRAAEDSSYRDKLLKEIGI